LLRIRVLHHRTLAFWKVLTANEQHQLREIARRGIGDLVATIHQFGDRVTEQDLYEAAKLAAEMGQDSMLDDFVSCGLSLSHAHELLQIAELHRRQWATSALRTYCELRAAEESLADGDVQPAIALLSAVYSGPRKRHEKENPKIRRTLVAARLLQRGLTPTATVNDEPLIIASVRLGLADVVRELLLAGVDPQTRGQSGRFALEFCETVSCAQCLLDHGADPLQSNKYGLCALAVKAADGPTEVFELLLQNSSENAARTINRLPPVGGIHEIRTAGRLRLPGGRFDRPDVHRLLGLGARWPMDWACALGNLSEARRLIGAGEDANAPNAYGLAPLELAIGWTTPSDEREYIVELLLENGAYPNGAPPSVGQPTGEVELASAYAWTGRQREWRAPLELALHRRMYGAAASLVDAGAEITAACVNLRDGMPEDVVRRVFR
jgi:hypothetical protein